MKICVFGAARDEIDPGFFALGEALGRALGERGHTLVFGGGAHGMMGAAARGCAAAGGAVIGVAPHFFRRPGVLFEGPATWYHMDTMAERKSVMEDLADGFIALPGGVGTMEEILEVVTLRGLGRMKKPIAFLDRDDYWRPTLAALENCVERGFAPASLREEYGSFTDPAECLDYLEREAAHDL